MFNKRRKEPRDLYQQEKKPANISAWDVVVLSFKLLFKRIQFWIRPNILMVLLSLPIITEPGAKAGLYNTVMAGLRDPAGSYVSAREMMKKGFRQHFWRSLATSLINIVVYAFIIVAIVFWITRDGLHLRFVSILAIYGLILWWLASGFVFPILVSEPELNAINIHKQAFLLAFRKPFQSLLFSVVNLLLLIFGVLLLGPIMLIIPAQRAIISIQAYWYLTGMVIPGFVPIEEYSRHHFNLSSEENS
jgi:uncharacterized membrane protein YesL